MLRSAPFLLLLGLLPQPALAWSPEGHEIVAAVAAASLTSAATAQVASLLGGGNMLVLDSSWADEIRDQRQDTAAWHYVDIPLDAHGYDPRRDCPKDDCVVGQIARDEKILANRRTPRAARAEALRFLIHFVADVHQPLHAADKGDEGGNRTIVYLRGKRTNLHHVWYNDVVGGLGSDPSAAARRLAANLSPQDKQKLSGGNPADWANESLGVARNIYASLPGPYLPNDYARRQSAVVRMQLTKAGLRLAAVLNRILQ